METAWDSMPMNEKTIDALRARLVQEERKIKRRKPESKHKGTIKNVLFVPDIGVSLLSIPIITELGFEVYFQQRDIRITRGGEIFMTGRRFGKPYINSTSLHKKK